MIKTVPEKRPFCFDHFWFLLRNHFDFGASDSRFELFQHSKKYRRDDYRQLILLGVNQAHIL